MIRQQCKHSVNILQGGWVTGICLDFSSLNRSNTAASKSTSDRASWNVVRAIEGQDAASHPPKSLGQLYSSLPPTTPDKAGRARSGSILIHPLRLHPWKRLTGETDTRPACSGVCLAALIGRFKSWTYRAVASQCRETVIHDSKTGPWQTAHCVHFSPKGIVLRPLSTHVELLLASEPKRVWNRT